MPGARERTSRPLDRRRSSRRKLPYVRSAVLEAGGKAHIVTVSDLGPEGAFLATRARLEPTGPLRLRIVLPRDGREVVLACEVVRTNGPPDPSADRPAGIAVRFRDADVAVVRRVQEFAREGLVPSSDPPARERFEYRLLERSEVESEELNQLGLDGWLLAAAHPHGTGFRMVLVRKL